MLLTYSLYHYIKKYENTYTEILQRGIITYTDKHANVKKGDRPEYVKTFSRMLISKEEHLRFMKGFKVPYTNNNAEKAR